MRRGGGRVPPSRPTTRPRSCPPPERFGLTGPGTDAHAEGRSTSYFRLFTRSSSAIRRATTVPVARVQLLPYP